MAESRFKNHYYPANAVGQLTPPRLHALMLSATTRLVLYVEDDFLNIVLMQEVIRRLPGWRLECAEDGQQALDLLTTDRPELPDLVVIVK